MVTHEKDCDTNVPNENVSPTPFLASLQDYIAPLPGRCAIGQKLREARIQKEAQEGREKE